jgi:hypothetical protein
LLHKIDAKDSEVQRIAEEKEQELLIMQEGMDTTLQELQNLRLVSNVVTPQHFVSPESDTWVHNAADPR